MRLWHKELIKVLPRQQLIAQWRELSAIVGNIKLKGTPNHLLVNPVMNYDFDHLITYASIVKSEMINREYKVNESVWEKIISLKPNFDIVSFDELFKDWHNSMYFHQCFFNLQEKYDRGGISQEDYDNIVEVTRKHIFKPMYYYPDGSKKVWVAE